MVVATGLQPLAVSIGSVAPQLDAFMRSFAADIAAFIGWSTDRVVVTSVSDLSGAAIGVNFMLMSTSLVNTTDDAAKAQLQAAMDALAAALSDPASPLFTSGSTSPLVFGQASLGTSSSTSGSSSNAGAAAGAAVAVIVVLGVAGFFAYRHRDALKRKFADWKSRSTSSSTPAKPAQAGTAYLNAKTPAPSPPPRPGARPQPAVPGTQSSAPAVPLRGGATAASSPPPIVPRRPAPAVPVQAAQPTQAPAVAARTGSAGRVSAMAASMERAPSIMATPRLAPAAGKWVQYQTDEGGQ
jgi:hypothetical protein